MLQNWSIQTSKIQNSTLFQEFNQKIKSDFFSNSKILIGLSGGVDSMVLAYFLYHYFLQKSINLDNIIFVHLNHNVRKESVFEQKQIKSWFAGTTLEVITKVKTASYTENDLRNRRYSTFYSLIKKHKAKVLFLGHHFDDRIETSLLNMQRGCGIDGFMGIKPQEKHYLLGGTLVIRPLLDFRKNQLLQEARFQKIPFVQDQTNFDSTISKRNYLRNQILPKLYADPNFENLFRQRYQKYDSMPLVPLISPITNNKLRNTEFAYVLLVPREKLTGTQLLQILKSLRSSGGLTKNTINDFLSFIQKSKKGRKQINQTLVIVAHSKVYFFGSNSKFREKTIDKSIKINKDGSVFRYPQKGDIYRGKTRNKYCITEKIPVFRRNFIPVCAKGNQIISRDRKSRKTNTIF